MNRLTQESSPYLRQHAENPVHWYPWGEEAFARAAAEDKPVLLSIGYSSCHWCHVMAHESFEDPATAAVMNKCFVSIKVDREERPDVDAVYMEATQAMSGQGGWPMTVFLHPDGRPFFAGTYFPKHSHSGVPGFVELLNGIDHAWHNDRQAIESQGDQLREAVATRTQAEPSDVDVYQKGGEWLDHAYAALEAAYDKEWGGFGRAPKFPQTMALELLLASRRPQHIDMVINTLDAMASGGIYDHIGGGFSRYSVDAFWMVPHFEKMLYDQASLARLYLHAYLVTGHQHLRQVVEETVQYVRRDLRNPQGGWYSAEDADSEGEEGRFSIWRPEQIEAALADDALTAEATNWYGVTKSGNFEGSNILHRTKRGDLLRTASVEEARRRLFEARAQRVRPGLDDKVLTEWNAMFIATLAEAGAALGHQEWIADAEAAGDFLLASLMVDGRWHRAWHKDSGARHLAVSADYAWLVSAFMALAEATGRAKWRALATGTANQMLDLFWDDERGGLFLTGADAETLTVRTKDLFDGASPSANSTAATALIRLAALNDDSRFRVAAEDIVRLLAAPAANHPTAFAHLLAAVRMLHSGVSETVVAGEHPELVQTAWTTFTPDNSLMWGERDSSPRWESRTDGAYVCRGMSCGPVATTPDELQRQLREP